MEKSKGLYPWRLGATSFVVPAGINENVRFLAPLVDDIQLLFFESAASTGLPQDFDLALLAESAAAHALSYTVHLPTDIRLGASGKEICAQGIAEITRLMTVLAPLAPRCFDLHLAREANLPEAAWLANLDESLSRLAGRLGAKKKLVAVENIDYPYALIAPLVRKHGFSVCADLGHAVRYGYALDFLPGQADSLLHLHCHGVENGKDHRAVRDEDAACALGAQLAETGFGGVVTVEVYSWEMLGASLATLQKAWQPFAGQGYD